MLHINTSPVPASLQGEWIEAMALFERCQAIEEKALGPEHPELAKTLFNRARLLKAQVRGEGNFQGTSCVARGRLRLSSTVRCCRDVD